LRHIPRTLRQWGVVAFLSIGCTLFAFLLQLWAIRRTSATRASLLMETEPVWAVLIGVLVGGEHVSVTALAGAAIVIAATIWGQQIELKPETPHLIDPESRDGLSGCCRAP
jgi:drug/metabolite transporter (DMT)-like permease